MRGLIMEKKIRKRIEQLQHYRQLGFHTLAQGDAYDAERKRKEQLDKAKKDKSGAFLQTTRPPTNTSGRRREAKEAELTAVPSNPKSARRAAAAPETPTQPGSNFLSGRESELCVALRLAPMQFLAVKDVIMREALRLGALQKSAARQLIKIVDVSKTDKIYDFIVSSGWIKPDRDPRTFFSGVPLTSP